MASGIAIVTHSSAPNRLADEEVDDPIRLMRHAGRIPEHELGREPEAVKVQSVHDGGGRGGEVDLLEQRPSSACRPRISSAAA